MICGILTCRIVHDASVVVGHVEVRRAIRRRLPVLADPASVNTIEQDRDPVVSVIARHLVDEPKRVRDLVRDDVELN